MIITSAELLHQASSVLLFFSLIISSSFIEFSSSSASQKQTRRVARAGKKENISFGSGSVSVLIMFAPLFFSPSLLLHEEKVRLLAWGKLRELYGLFRTSRCARQRRSACFRLFLCEIHSRTVDSHHKLTSIEWDFTVSWVDCQFASRFIVELKPRGRRSRGIAERAFRLGVKIGANIIMKYE